MVAVQRLKICRAAADRRKQDLWVGVGIARGIIRCERVGRKAARQKVAQEKKESQELLVSAANLALQKLLELLLPYAFNWKEINKMNHCGLASIHVDLSMSIIKSHFFMSLVYCYHEQTGNHFSNICLEQLVSICLQ